MIDNIINEEGGIFVLPDNKNSFEPSPYIDPSTDTEDPKTVTISAGRWITSSGITDFVETDDIGDETNRFIIANLTSGLIEAQSTAPDETETTKRLLVELIYETYSVGSDEYPDNPPYDGQEVLVSWNQRQYGDIYDAGESLDAQFKVTSGPSDVEFTIASGTWERNQIKAEYTGATYDPYVGIAEQGPILAGAGTVYLYLLLVKSDGTGSVRVIASINKINVAYESTGQFKFLAELTYDMDGSNPYLKTIIQGQLGAIHDTTSSLLMYKSADFSCLVDYTAGVDTEPFVTFAGGTWRSRNLQIAVPASSSTEITSALYFYASLDQSGASTVDVSLRPDSASPGVYSNAALQTENGYGWWFQNLCKVNVVSIVATEASSYIYILVFEKIYHPGGMIRHDWVRPDGKDIGGDGATFDSDLPRIASIDFRTSENHVGELQQYQAFERIIESGNFLDTDKVLAYYNSVSLAGTTPTDYCYLDTHGYAAGHTAAGKSLEITDYRLQLKDFHNIGTYFDLEDCDTLKDRPYHILVRDPSGATPELLYMVLTILAKIGTGADAVPTVIDKDTPTSLTGAAVRGARSDHTHGWDGNANHADSADTAGYADYAGSATHADTATDVTNLPSHTHSEHSAFMSDDHNASTGYPYLLLGGDATRNNMPGVIGDASNFETIAPSSRTLTSDGVTPHIVLQWTEDYWLLKFDDDNNWDINNFEVKAVAGITLIGGDVHIFPYTSTAGGVIIGEELAVWSTLDMLFSGKGTCKFADFDLLTSEAAGSGTVNIGTESLEWSVVSLFGLVLDLNGPNGINYDGVAGVSITDWTTHGGVTGADIVEISAEDLLPSDKILVRH